MPINAIILAAGEGTRMKSRHPKVAHKLLDKPLVWWSVDAARKAGADRIIVVVGNGADEVRAIFANDADVECVEQTERLGTGHAVRVVRDAIGGFQGPTMVLTGDTPLVRPETLHDLIQETMEHHNACTVLTMEPPDPFGYGRIRRSASGAVEAIIEHKDCTPEEQVALTECNSGIFCFCGGRLTANIDKLGTNNAQGEYYLTDMVGIYVQMGEPVSAVCAKDYSEMLGINSRFQLATATKFMQARINEQHMNEGVTMLDPSQVWIGPNVTIGRDTVLLPGTMLWGTTHVGEECTIGPNALLNNATIADRQTVRNTVIEK